MWVIGQSYFAYLSFQRAKQRPFTDCCHRCTACRSVFCSSRSLKCCRALQSFAVFGSSWFCFAMAVPVRGFSRQRLASARCSCPVCSRQESFGWAAAQFGFWKCDRKRTALGKLLALHQVGVHPAKLSGFCLFKTKRKLAFRG